jgi:predicted phosphodiesterase
MLEPLEAVLAELERERVDAIVLGGDVIGGPQPAETLARLREVELPLHWIRGNGERALAGDDGSTGDEDALEYTAERVSDDEAAFLVALPETLTLEIDELGRVLFCHATPRSDQELITPATPDDVLLRVTEGIEERVVVAGHSHMQLDRCIGDLRWVNAGSVGMPFEGEVAAFWTVVGPDVERRRTRFDLERAVEAIEATAWPPTASFVEENIRTAITRDEATEDFERIARELGER